MSRDNFALTPLNAITGALDWAPVMMARPPPVVKIGSMSELDAELTRNDGSKSTYPSYAPSQLPHNQYSADISRRLLFHDSKRLLVNRQTRAPKQSVPCDVG